MNKGKIKRVVFEYENSIEYLDEQCDVAGWLDTVNNMCVMSANRVAGNYDWSKHQWKVWNTAEIIKNNDDDTNTGITSYNTSHLFE